MLKYLRAEDGAEAAKEADAEKVKPIVEQAVESCATTSGTVETKLEEKDVMPASSLEVVETPQSSIPMAKSEGEEEDDEDDDDDDDNDEDDHGSKLVVKDENERLETAVTATDKNIEMAPHKDNNDKTLRVLNSINYLNFLLSDSSEHKNQQQFQELQEEQHADQDQVSIAHAKKETVDFESAQVPVKELTTATTAETIYNDEESADTDTVYVDDDLSNIVAVSFRYLDSKLCDNLLENTKQLTSEEQFHQAFLLNVSTLTYECFFLFKIQFSFIRLAISVS
jgi:hypothetical protein